MTALIPIIKKKRPHAKIIFRSHIQSEQVASEGRVAELILQSRATSRTTQKRLSTEHGTTCSTLSKT